MLSPQILSLVLLWLHVQAAPSPQQPNWTDSSDSFNLSELQDNFATLFNLPNWDDGSFGKLTGSIGDGVGEVLGDHSLHFLEGDVAAKSNCYFILMKPNTPTEIRNQLANLLSTIRGDLRLKLASALFQGHYVCFPGKDLPLTLLQKIPWIDVVEHDQLYKKSILDEQQNPKKLEDFSIYQTSQIQTDVDWSLGMINYRGNTSANHEARPYISSDFGFDVLGNSSHIYLVDSGVNGALAEFGPPGRVKLVHSIYDKDLADVNKDCDGHGTKVASLIAGLEHGVAKGAAVHAIEAMDCEGEGSTSGIIEALYWMLQDISEKGIPTRKVILNLSLGGPRSAILDVVMGTILSRNITVVAAAGNENTIACTKSPAGYPGVLAVGAINSRKERATFSNYGDCVAIMAPGESIRVLTKDNDIVRNSGTSLSAPLVTGVVALLMDLNPDASAQELKQRLYEIALKGTLASASLKNAPNILLQAPAYNSAGGAPLVAFPPKAPSSAPAKLLSLFITASAATILFI
jgi:subtilisin family serine protease